MMRSVAAIIMTAQVAVGWVYADDVRFVEQNGVTYRETRQIVQRPVTEITHQPTDRTVYREQLRTDMQNAVQVYSVPITEWRAEAYWRGRWNPFVQPYLAQRYVPYTRWETRTVNAQVPVTRREVVAEVRTEHVPVVTQRMINDEVVQRVAVSGSPSGNDPFASPTTQLARRDQIGGISRLDGIPPKQVSTGGWRPSTGTIIR